jgi:hypothetical protein
MNEKIRILAEQARSEVRSKWDKGNKIPYPESHHSFQLDIEKKFAELIVKECINQIEQLIGEEDEIDYGEFYNGLRAACKQIQHSVVE